MSDFSSNVGAFKAMVDSAKVMGAAWLLGKAFDNSANETSHEAEATPDPAVLELTEQLRELRGQVDELIGLLHERRG